MGGALNPFFVVHRQNPTKPSRKKGCAAMSNVTRLHLVEDVQFERARQIALVQALGEAEADRVIGRAIEEIAVRLTRIERAYAQGELFRVEKGARGLAAIAEQTGLPTVRRLALVVADLTATNDPPALAANISRLIRVGEISLVTIWDVQDISV